MLTNSSSRLRGFVSYFVASFLIAAAALHTACSGGGGGSSGGGGSAAPQANFSGSPTSGQRPLDVQFTDTSTGTVADWAWDFGDGSLSTLRNPLHRYEHPGSFTVQLTVTGAGGFTTKVRTDFIAVTAPLLDPGFESQTAGASPGLPWDVFFGPQGNLGSVVNSAAGGPDANMPSEGQLWVELGGDSTNDVLPPSAGPGPTARTGAGIAQEFSFPAGQSALQLDVVFVNGEGIGVPLANDWMSVDISDGASSIALLRRDTFSPMSNHSILHGGSRTTALETVTVPLQSLFPSSNFLTGFTVTVQVGNGGNGSLPSQVYVDNLRFEAPQPDLIAQFTGNPTQITQGGQVSFTDQTAGATAWVWDFGDGRGSNEQHPHHVYSATGVFDVKLHVTAPGTQGELVKAAFIHVLAPNGTVQFDGQPSPVAVGVPVLFTNLSNGNFNNTWLWEFGDGQTSNLPGFGPRVSHSYSNVGAKSVKLTGTLINGTPIVLLKPNYIDVQAPVAITSHPLSTTVNQGQIANFSVVANGTGPLNYQWRRNGVAIPGAPNSPNFATAPTTPADNGAKFRVLVSNAVSSSLSNEATLTVNLTPVITVQPQDVTVSAGTPAQFNVTATGTPPLTFIWRKNGQAIPGAPNLPSFTTAPTTPGNNGELYSVRISNSAGFVVSNSALLTVTSGPAITVQPQNQSVCAGSTALFSVTATGTPPLSFQWRKNGVNIPGANSSAFTTPPTVPGDNGALFSVRVSNASGNTLSQNATLTVHAAPSITAQPANASVCSGSTAQFQVSATGGGLSFQWRKNGVNIPGATNNVFTTPATVPGDNGALFSCRVSNNCNNVLSNNATLTVKVGPSISVQPQATLFVIVGAQAQFSVTATGSAPLAFQWRRNGVNIPGATSSLFSLPAVALGDDAVQFSCVVSNSCNQVTSNSGTLQVAKKWSTIYAASISSTCTGCHGTSGGLTLAGGASVAHGNTVGVPTSSSNTCAGSQRIKLQDPNDSSLFRVLGGTFSCISQDHTSFLNATQRQEIFDCIMAGIPNN